MSRRDRARVRPRVSDTLESRCLLAAPVIPGNIGQVVQSQFQPFGFRGTVGTQLRHVKVRGPIQVDVVNPFPATGPGPSATAVAPPINSGLVAQSQFNGGGFRTVGLQLDHVKLGCGLTVSGFDNEDPGPASTAQALASSTIKAGTARAGGTLPALINRGAISGSQFSDGGFGVIDRRPVGTVIAREGRVGLQWRKTRVRGPVDIGIGDLVIQPGATASAPLTASDTPASSSSTPRGTVVDLTTNIGRIRDSQFNDGGFGDIGMQWSDVSVGGRVGTTTSTLFLKPQQDHLGPINLTNLDFGRRTLGTLSSANPRPIAQARASAGPAASEGPLAAAETPPFETTYTNSATNSGRITGGQFNDGGFGDIGLQWRKVHVGGSVTAAHNSLTVQPENHVQGLITLRGIHFPTSPPPSPQPRPAPGPSHVLPDDPSAIANDGDPVTQLLPTPTGPLSPFFPTPFDGAGTVTLPYPGNYPLVNAATNSGLIKGGQFNAGGFGDQGLQWQNVRVGGKVALVHNSLSVHPEGSKLEGISVSDVSYGPPISRRVARHLAVLPYAVISPGDSSPDNETSLRPRHRPGRALAPPNDRILTNQQLASVSGTDVFLQWNGIEHRGGLVLVHNVIKLTGVGPTTGPITLQNIRFPYRVPIFAPLSGNQGGGTGARLRNATRDPVLHTTGDEPRGAALLNTANNSGILSHAQFSDGGFGDDGLQWRNVSVDGPVSVVHNTLAVDESADLPAGDVPGPITISNITFNSKTLDDGATGPRGQVLISPPDVFQQRSSHPVNLGKPLPRNPNVRNEATNTGIMAGGQLEAGGANHALLQWQCVKVTGKVTVIDNVLSISVLDRPSGPITISNVTFA